jgi:hypothetical protein
MEDLETQQTLSTRYRTWKNAQSRDTGNINTIDKTWKNGQSRDTEDIKHKR